MNVQFYFDPVVFSAYYDSGHLSWKYSLGSEIEKNTRNLSEKNIGNLKIVIIGAPFDSSKVDSYSTESSDRIRLNLYQLAGFNTKIKIADLGNLKPASSVKGNYQALRDVIDYFNELKITTVVIGGSQDLSFGICQAFGGNKYFSFSTVDAFLDIRKGNQPFDSGNYLSRLFINQPDLFQFNLIGYQSYYVSAEQLKMIKTVSNHIRLGKIREDITVLDPVLRNTDFLSVDINSVKHSEAPGSKIITPNGLRGEEICQLAKYAGLSNRLKVFGLFDVLPGNDQNNQTAKLGAQIIWYFLEGFINRDDTTPDSNENIITYKVEVEGVEKPMVFYKHNITGRWWMQLETKENEKLYFACSVKEYEQASNSEIPELWLNYIQKIDKVLK